jgi:hypothetical protein
MRVTTLAMAHVWLTAAQPAVTSSADSLCQLMSVHQVMHARISCGVNAHWLI